MYRNCTYNHKTKSIFLWTWDAFGNRVTQELPYKPYLFLESKTGTEKSIYGTTLKRREFDTGWDRNKFVQESGIKRIFENLPPYQQFLIDEYYRDCGNDDFAKHPLKIMFLDLECPSPPSRGFPEPELAEEVINLITCYDSLSKKYTQFGLKSHTSQRADVVYHHCKSEEDLLKRFIGHFSSDYPDAIVGYNSNRFDIPYLVNRITFQLGKEWADELSPIGRIYEKINREGKFGQPTKEYVIDGICCLDYYVMYKKFAMAPLESYKLDYVAEVELGENKISYDGSLWDLAKNNWDTFTAYNLIDVELMVKLDDKLRYVELLRFISYLGLCNMENAIKTLPVVNGAVAVRARFRGEKIPTFVRPQINDRIPGAYVADPKIGFSEKIVSFDANSLYPSVMISLNMSPETKIGKVEKIDDIYHIKHVSGRTFELTRDNYIKYIREEKLAKSEFDILFSQKKKGIMPEFLDFLYSKRKEMKSKMFEAKQELLRIKNTLTTQEQLDREFAIQKYNTFQHAYKITLNSTYGYCVNEYAPLGDIDIGASVTLTGQSALKQSIIIYEDYLKTRLAHIPNINAGDYYLYSDTDSDFLSFKWVDLVGVPFMTNNKISDEFYAVCDEVENEINVKMGEWAKRKLWSIDPRFVFKRESICDHGIFIGKKYYVLHMLDDEGVKVDKFKYKGVDVVKSTMPKAIKPHVKKIIETMLSTQSVKDTNQAFIEAYEIFKDLGVESIYKNSGINNYEKYAKQCNGFTTVKGMPSHVKAAYYHDLLLDKLGVGGKYEKFKSGDKVKSVYVNTPNRYGVDMIGFKGVFPEEFNDIFEVDYDKMFTKILYAAIKRFYDAVDWKLRKPNENVKIELDDFLS